MSPRCTEGDSLAPRRSAAVYHKWMWNDPHQGTLRILLKEQKSIRNKTITSTSSERDEFTLQLSLRSWSNFSPVGHCDRWCRFVSTQVLMWHFSVVIIWTTLKRPCDSAPRRSDLSAVSSAFKKDLIKNHCWGFTRWSLTSLASQHFIYLLYYAAVISFQPIS